MPERGSDARGKRADARSPGLGGGCRGSRFRVGARLPPPVDVLAQAEGPRDLLDGALRWSTF